jgi:hypothetical protein
MPSGKKSKQMRRAAEVAAPPPVRSKGRGARAGLPTGNRKLWLGGAGAVLVVAAIVLAITLSGGSANSLRVDFSQMPGLQTGPPPWNNGVGELQDRLAQVHLNPLGGGTTAFHIHQHLDVFVNGKHVTVPKLIGIYDGSFVTEIHTHTSDGVIHVESPTNRDYTLGQLFGEWSVRLTASCLGRYCGDLHWWVDGKPQTGDPSDLVLRPHQEIVVAAGKPPAHIPSSHKFPAGE